MSEQIRILCVDDEQNVLNALRRIFMDDDYEIVIANSGKDGIRLLEEKEFQIVISDYRMPEMNGVEFLKQVYDNWPDTVRIVLSGYADAGAIVSAINEGRIYKFIPKPWNDDELKITIKNALERYFLFKENVKLTGELKYKNTELQKLNTQLEQYLALRTEMLEAHQRILDSIPLGVVGIDSNGMVACCNEQWVKLINHNTSVLSSFAENVFDKPMLDFIEEVKEKGSAEQTTTVNGAAGRLMGKKLGYEGEYYGVTVVFIPECAA
ncbi:MAG: response regulator [Nitrospirae bacterium]|nr:MAG: response regulator [Nitrospirota bacterium]